MPGENGDTGAVTTGAATGDQTSGAVAPNDAVNAPSTGAGTEGVNPEGATLDTGAEGVAQDGDADEGAQGAPETYEAFTVPEGFALDAERVEAASAIFKDLNLTQEQAQKLVDFDLQRTQKEEAGRVERWEQTMTEWKTASEKDPEIGGAAFQENVAQAKLGLDAVGTPELVSLLEATGTGNHPEVLRVFHRIGKLVKDDVIHVAKTPTKPAQKSTAQKIYTSHS